VLIALKLEGDVTFFQTYKQNDSYAMQAVIINHIWLNRARKLGDYYITTHFIQMKIVKFAIVFFCE